MPLATTRVLFTVLTCALAAAASRSTAADEGVSLVDAVTKGKLSLDLRYRYETVDQDSFDDAGRASTLRSTLAYRTLDWHHLAAHAEFEDVRDLGLSGDHNNGGAGSLGNGVSDRPVIADPAITELNQAFLEWQPSAGLSLRGGRQEVIFDNARLVGNVAWRQNHQGFDGVVARYSGVPRLKLAYAFLDRQRTVGGASRPMSTSHFDVAYTFGPYATVRAYLLELDYDDQAQWALSTRTVGAALTGTHPLGEGLAFSYRAEAAAQADTGDNPHAVDADYLRADLGLEVGKVTVGAGYELLGGSPTEGAFQTPLATLHAFNGWADLFLTTPADGLRDLFVSCGAGLGPWKLLAVYHDFTADAGGADYGTEVDASVVFTTPWKQKLAVEVARYDADRFATDTDKVFVWTQWGF